MRPTRVPVLLLALMFPRLATPGTIGLTWQGPDGSWTDSKWASSGVPVPYFPNNGSNTYQVTITNGSVVLSSSVAVDTLNLTGGELTLAAGGSLALEQAGSTSAAALALSGGTLTGSGDFTNAAGGTITGAGTLNLTVTNNATIEASGGVLHLSGIHVWNTNGTIRALDGSTVRMTTPTTGGRIETVGTGALELDSTFTDAAITNSAGTVSMVSSAQLLGTSTLTNAGTLNIESGKGLQLFTGSTLLNSGAVNISGRLDLAGAGSSNSGTITVDAGKLSLGANFTNSGTIQLNGASSGMDVFGPATLSGTGSVVFSGGLINVQGGATLTNAGNTIEGFGTVTGVLNNQGDVRATGGILTIENLTNLSGNTLTGGTYYVAGTLELLGATSIRELDADLTMDGTGALIKNASGGDALAGLYSIKSVAALTLLNNYTLTGSVSQPRAPLRQWRHPRGSF